MTPTAGLKGQVAIVTGGGSAMGKSIALALAREGVKLAIAGRTQAKLNKAAAEIRRLGVEVVALPTDVGHTAPVAKMVQAAVDQLGPVDILINNAGDDSFAFGAAQDLAEKKWEDQERLFLRSQFLCSKAALTIGGMLKRRRGLIVNTSSDNVRTTYAGWAAHCAFRHAALGFTASLRKEVASFGIRVTLLCPGPILTTPSQQPNVRTEVERVYRNGAWLDPQHLAALTVFIAKLPSDVTISEVQISATGLIER